MGPQKKEIRNNNPGSKLIDVIRCHFDVKIHNMKMFQNIVSIEMLTENLEVNLFSRHFRLEKIKLELFEEFRAERKNI